MSLTKSEENALDKGDEAPEFSLKNVDGSTVQLKDFEGKSIAVIFMCNHCPYVVPKMDEIAELQNKVVVICVNSNDAEAYTEDSFENMQKYAKEKGYKYYLYDETQEVAKEYGAVCTPDPFLFDKDHKLIYHGRINNAMNPSDTPTKHDMEEAIEKMLNNEEIDPWFNPSIGCSIKWKE